MEDRDLCGIWILDSPDPGWTAFLELNEEGNLWLRSTRENEVAMKGMWRLDNPDLVVVGFYPPFTQDQEEFIRQHLPECTIRFDGGLRFGSLTFRRHTKNA